LDDSSTLRVPTHPYTALLIEAIPVPDPDVRPAERVPAGEPPSPMAPAVFAPAARGRMCDVPRSAGTSRRGAAAVRGLPSSIDRDSLSR